MWNYYFNHRRRKRLEESLKEYKEGETTRLDDSEKEFGR